MGARPVSPGPPRLIHAAAAMLTRWPFGSHVFRAYPYLAAAVGTPALHVPLLIEPHYCYRLMVSAADGDPRRTVLASLDRPRPIVVPALDSPLRITSEATPAVTDGVMDIISGTRSKSIGGRRTGIMSCYPFPAPASMCESPRQWLPWPLRSQPLPQSRHPTIRRRSTFPCCRSQSWQSPRSDRSRRPV